MIEEKYKFYEVSLGALDKEMKKNAYMSHDSDRRVSHGLKC